MPSLRAKTVIAASLAAVVLAGIAFYVSPILSGYFPKPGTVTIVLEPSIYKAAGREFSGHGHIYISYGDKIIHRELVKELEEVKAGRTVRVQVEIPDNILDDWARHSRALKQLLAEQNYGVSVEIPAVTVTFYFTSPSSKVKICTATYSARDWYLEKLHNPIEAGKKTIEDPLRMFVEGAIIRINSEKLRCGTVETKALEEALVENLQSRGVKASWQPGFGLVIGGNKTAMVVAKPGKTVDGLTATTTASNCPGYMEVVYNWDLYNSRYSPPSSWYERLRGIPRSQAECLWRLFAETYSKKYYFNADIYSYDEARSYTVNKLGGGLYPMQNFIARLINTNGGACTGGYIPTWYPSPVPDPNPTLDTPWLGVVLSYTTTDLETFKPIQVSGALAAGKLQFAYSGISFFGIPVWENPYGGLQMYASPAGTSAEERAYVLAPTMFLYLGDAAVVLFNSETVTFPDGCRYYVFWADVAFIPLYKIQSVDWSKMKPDHLDLTQLPPNYMALSWSAHAELVKYAYAGTRKETLLYETSSADVVEGGAGLAAAIYSVYQPWLESVLSGILGTTGNILASYMVSVIKAAIGFTQFTIEGEGMAHAVEVRVQDVTPYAYPIRIYKMRCPDVLAEEYTSIGYEPYTVEYIVEAGEYTGAPPGAT
ncbi:hypothetical protein [Hyperthermus butylicus]|uniref:Uncharacterized protein n=1 Tax=Hyperthermus butylicus (strain DSM 5456 / JCM 9403 / PLM1-5) TaxID=415426 RepID=A2BKV2_HYPBU|nr:hypothetical protein [Hyperthermus butylicus]ABM80613.1 hypothetical protein Hbut_0759 [Hyperthermus butylicus DSM 5456]